MSCSTGTKQCSGWAIPANSAPVSTQSTNKCSLWGAPQTLPPSSKADPVYRRLPANRVNSRADTTVCSECRPWRPHALVKANQDHHFPMKPASSIPLPGLPRGPLLKSRSLPQLQNPVASAGNIPFRPLMPVRIALGRGTQAPWPRHTPRIYHRATPDKSVHLHRHSREERLSPEIRFIHQRPLQRDGCHAQQLGEPHFTPPQQQKKSHPSWRTEQII